MSWVNCPSTFCPGALLWLSTWKVGTVKVAKNRIFVQSVWNPSIIFSGIEGWGIKNSLKLGGKERVSQCGRWTVLWPKLTSFIILTFLDKFGSNSYFGSDLNNFGHFGSVLELCSFLVFLLFLAIFGIVAIFWHLGHFFRFWPFLAFPLFSLFCYFGHIWHLGHFWYFDHYRPFLAILGFSWPFLVKPSRFLTF